MDSLKNKVILVTGGSSGIGKAMAIKFSLENKVIVIDNDKLACESLRESNEKNSYQIIIK